LKVALLKQVAPLESEEAGIDDVLEVADPHEVYILLLLSILSLLILKESGGISTGG
jgi:hypothetical protein